MITVLHHAIKNFHAEIHSNVSNAGTTQKSRRKTLSVYNISQDSTRWLNALCLRGTMTKITIFFMQDLITIYFHVGFQNYFASY